MAFGGKFEAEFLRKKNSNPRLSIFVSTFALFSAYGSRDAAFRNSKDVPRLRRMLLRCAKSPNELFSEKGSLSLNVDLRNRILVQTSFHKRWRESRAIVVFVRIRQAKAGHF